MTSETLAATLEPILKQVIEDAHNEPLVSLAMGPLAVMLDSLIQGDDPVLFALAMAGMLCAETAKHPDGGGEEWRGIQRAFLVALRQVAITHRKPDQPEQVQ